MPNKIYVLGLRGRWCKLVLQGKTKFEYRVLRLCAGLVGCWALLRCSFKLKVEDAWVRRQLVVGVVVLGPPVPRYGDHRDSAHVWRAEWGATSQYKYAYPVVKRVIFRNAFRIDHTNCLPRVPAWASWTQVRSTLPGQALSKLELRLD